MQTQPPQLPPPPAPAQLPPAPANWWDPYVDSFVEVGTLLLHGVLKFLGFLLIILIGWIISAWLGKAVAAILRKLKFNELAQRTGLANLISKMGAEKDPAGVIGEVVKWLIRIVVLVIAFAALGLPALSAALNQFILWIPNLVIALAVLLIGGLAANALGDIVRGITADAGFRNPNTLASVARVAVWVFAIVIAVNQVGIGDELVNTLLIAVVAAVGLAVGLAFGLGGRDLAAKTLARWHSEAQETRDRVDSPRPGTTTPGT
ncbi:MAG TPA: hypothetical protein VM779_08895, partial [Thermoanaerobaculia bacterium]|nr:hypothetical protein [Thermoanaerobaculia bacterium]